MIKKMFKSKKFLKILLIPYGIWFLFTLFAMIPEKGETDPLTFGDVIIANFAVLIIWFILLSIVYSVIYFIKQKTKNEVKLVQVKVENKESAVQENKIEDKLEDKIKKENKTKEKYLYSCESKIDSKEYGKMSKYFPKIYWSYVMYATILNIIVTLLIHIIFNKLILTIQFFIIFQLFIMLFYKVRIENIASKSFNKIYKKLKYKTQFYIEFYNSFLIRKNETSSQKIYYYSINKCIETPTNFYLLNENKTPSIIIQKEKCSEELIQFIRNEFNDIKIRVNKERIQKKLKNYKFVKILMIILFIFTILSIWFALGTISLLPIDSSDYGFFKNTWVFWLWLPIPILSVLLGIKYKKYGIKCNKNIIAGLLVGFSLLIYGSFFLLFKDINNFDNSLFIITRNELVDQTKYYEVNYKENKRQVKKFESQVDNVYTARGCLNWHDVVGIYPNEITWETCEIVNENEEKIKLNKVFKNIISNVQKEQLEHAIFEIKILKVKDDYYVVVTLNVNFWTPYELYYYDNKTKELNKIITFSNEDVIGIKLK